MLRVPWPFTIFFANLQYWIVIDLYEFRVVQLDYIDSGMMIELGRKWFIVTKSGATSREQMSLKWGRGLVSN